VLGVQVSLSEAEVYWRTFFSGLHGIKLMISDAHSGIKAARKAVMPSVPWQRCHLVRLITLPFHGFSLKWFFYILVCLQILII
jgi:transposase-like protein